MTGAAIKAWFRGAKARWLRHRHTDNAAALTFYALISLTPLLLFGVTLAGLILGERAAHGELNKQLTAVLGPETAEMIAGVLQSARIAPGSDPAAFGVAMIMLLYAGSHVISKLRKSLNLVNEVNPATPARPWLARLLARILCASLLLLFGILLVAGTMIEGFAAFVSARVDPPWVGRLDLLQGTRWLSTYLLLGLAFTLILKILPRRRPLWWHAAIGGAFGAVVVGSLKGLLDIYLRNSMWVNVIGGGLTLLAFLFWLFISFQAFLAGAEIAAWLGRRRREGSGGLRSQG